VTGPTSLLPARRPLLLFLYSTRNLAGSALALLGLGLHFLGLLEAWWLPIVAGLYAIGYLAAPQPAAQSLALGDDLTAEAVTGRLRQLVKTVARGVDDEVLTLVKSIEGSIEVLLPRLLAQEGIRDRNLYVVRQTALEYLPATLEAYLTLPPAFRRVHVVSGGKTPRTILLEQLSLLDAKMKEIVTGVAQNDAQALEVNGRFLAEKFGTQSFALPA
jgi:hypothetical protein